MKILLAFLFSVFLFASQAEPLSYYEQFFDRINDVTHDPDFPQSESVTAKSDIYQVAMTGENSAIGVILSFSLRETGEYSFWMLNMQQRWKNGQRQMKIGKCQAFNGKWRYENGKLALGSDLILGAAFAFGQNMMKPEFTGVKRPAGTEGLEVLINDGSIDTIGGVGPGSPGNGEFRCGGFQLPFWIPIPNERPW